MNMRTGTRRDSGFTVIELVVVVVILCILSALVALTYSGVQSKNRNTERQNDIDALKSQLELYYAGTSTYPTLANINNPAWRAQNMKHLANDSVQDPTWNKSVAACTKNAQPTLSAKPAADCYDYQVISSDGSACDNDKTPCAHYTLTANLEGGEKYVKSSLN